MTVELNGKNLTIEQVYRVAYGHEKVVLSEEGKAAVLRCRGVVEDLVAKGEAIYGVTTGIGELARVRVSPEQGAELQKRIVYSHSAGVGNFFEEAEVRAAILLRANVLSKGYSAVRLLIVETLIEMLNRNVIPAVNEKGSVGTSGDLSPMSQIAEVVIGEGRAFWQGKLMNGGEAMKAAGLTPVVLSFKEGLGIINGSQMFTGCGALRLYEAYRMAKSAIIASAVACDALRTPKPAFDPRPHDIRPYNGQRVVARALRQITADSQLIATGHGKVQDAYSLRCVPQVYGPCIDAMHYAKTQIDIEMNAGSDNPLFFPDDGIAIAAGNFHGEPIAMALDFLGIAVAELASLSERHTNRLLNPSLSKLPGFLVKGEGLNSGMMVAHYTAAALVSENKILAHPAVVDNISLAADQEDSVSMGPIAARKLKEILFNTKNVLAVEVMCAVQAFDFQSELAPGKGSAAVHKLVREHVTRLEIDRVLYPDIQKIAELIGDWRMLDAVEKEVGEINLIY